MTCKRARALLAAAGTLAAAAACRSEPTPPPRGARPDSVYGAALWHRDDFTGDRAMTPVLDSGVVYFLASGGSAGSYPSVVALDRATGRPRWHQPVVSSQNVAVAGDRVAAIWGSLYLLDRATGARQGVVVLPSSAFNTNVATDGRRFYAGTHDGRAVAVDPATGVPAWDVAAAGDGAMTAFGVAVGDGDLVVAFKGFPTAAAPGERGVVALLDAGTGALKWRHEVPDSLPGAGVVEAPVLIGDVVVAVTQGHEVRALDRATGATRWRADLSGGHPRVASGGLASCGGQVVAPTGDLGLAALDAATGRVVWRVPDVGLGSLSAVVCAHGTALAAAGLLKAFDARTGAELARYPTAGSDERHQVLDATRDERYLYLSTTSGLVATEAP